ncbi:hypothetical protein E2C01_000210 [Portunus trituberculatus]|uniref:Uncharacterized protein n=1 Tax=Portunus trituberculatus TaxID=210409 RepID=A0A5B7CEB6_PORTR|nr:hypothetical protein [Portunus trituberculatus]
MSKGRPDIATTTTTTTTTDILPLLCDSPNLLTHRSPHRRYFNTQNSLTSPHQTLTQTERGAGAILARRPPPFVSSTLVVKFHQCKLRHPALASLHSPQHVLSPEPESTGGCSRGRERPHRDGATLLHTHTHTGTKLTCGRKTTTKAV